MTVGVDIPPSHNQYVVVFLHYASKWPATEAISVADQKAETIARLCETRDSATQASPLA